MKITFRAFLIGLLPFAHLCACVAVLLLKTDWDVMMVVDFPVSVVCVALSFALGLPVLWFGILGTLWWYFLAHKGARKILERRKAPG
jgi:hypothetical protein